MTTPPALTPRQADTLKVIASRQVNRKCGPTIREVAAVLDVSGNAVQGFVRKLRESGHVEPDTGNGLIVCTPEQPVGAWMSRNAAHIQAFHDRIADRSDRKPLLKSKGKLL